MTELKEELTRRHELRKEQDDRADKTMTMSSTIATLLIGLGAFLVTYMLKPDTLLFYVEVIILSIGVILAAGAIVFFLLAHQVRLPILPFSSAGFVEEAGDGFMPQLKFEEIDKFSSMTAVKFEELTIATCLISLHSVEDQIRKKSNRVVMGQRLFLGSILTVSLVLLVAIVGTAIWPSASLSATNTTNSLPIPGAGIN